MFGPVLDVAVQRTNSPCNRVIGRARSCYQWGVSRKAGDGPGQRGAMANHEVAGCSSVRMLGCDWRYECDSFTHLHIWQSFSGWPRKAKGDREGKGRPLRAEFQLRFPRGLGDYCFS